MVLGSHESNTEMFTDHSVHIALLFHLLVFVHARKYAGPFDIDWYGAGLCDNIGSNAVRVNIRVISHSRGLTSISGNVSLPWGMNDSMTVDIKVSIWTNNAWKSLLHQNFGGMCTAVKRYSPEVAKVVFRVFHSADCPGPGNYSFENESVPTKVQGIPLPIYGRMRLEIGILKISNFQKVGCFYLEADFLPKKKFKSTRDINPHN